MNLKQKLNCLERAYTTQKRGDEDIYVIDSQKLSEEEYDAIKGVQFKLNEETGTFELDYEIMATACSLIIDNYDSEIGGLDGMDFQEISQDSASVYTSVRLSWLNMNNEADISEIQKEYQVNINVACAIWYEQQVARACELIRAWLLEDNTQ